VSGICGIRQVNPTEVPRGRESGGLFAAPGRLHTHRPVAGRRLRLFRAMSWSRP